MLGVTFIIVMLRVVAPKNIVPNPTIPRIILQYWCDCALTTFFFNLLQCLSKWRQKRFTGIGTVVSYSCKLAIMSIKTILSIKLDSF